jgi:hypothetical protein
VVVSPLWWSYIVSTVVLTLGVLGVWGMYFWRARVSERREYLARAEVAAKDAA